MNTGPEQGAAGAAISAEEFAQFLGQISLQNVWLSKAQVENLDGPVAPGDAQMNIQGAAEWANGDGGFRVFQQFRLTLSKEDHVSLRAEVVFGLEFRSEIPMADSLFEPFKVPTLLLMVWPYLREYVGSVVARMNWSGYTIPIMALQQTLLAPPAASSAPARPRKAPRSRRSKAREASPT